MHLEQFPRAMCHSLLVELRADGLNELPAHDARIDTALGNILDLIENQCRVALDAGHMQFVDECLYVLDQLGPDASTGRHDLFWAKLRELQPGSLAFGNPTYKTASISKHFPGDYVYDLGDHWKELISSSARAVTSALRK
jgi:hypothetical protein